MAAGAAAGVGRTQAFRAAGHTHRHRAGGQGAGRGRKRRLPVILWRIATETRKYAATDLSGAGAARSPGRWNEEGEAVVYAAVSIALAVLETAAHINDRGLPMNRFVVRIDVPQDVWDARQERPAAALP